MNPTGRADSVCKCGKFRALFSGINDGGQVVIITVSHGYFHHIICPLQGLCGIISDRFSLVSENNVHSPHLHSEFARTVASRLRICVVQICSVIVANQCLVGLRMLPC